MNLLQFDYDPDDYPIYQDILDLVCTSLSILGSLVMFYLCLRLPSPRSQSVNFVLALAVVDFLYAMTNVLSFFEDRDEDAPCTTFCKIEAIIRGFSFFLSVFFATCIGLTCLKAQLPDHMTVAGFLLKYAYSIGLGLSTILYIILPHCFPEYIIYDTDPQYSWVKYADSLSDMQKVLALMVLEGIPIILGILITLKTYLFTIRELKEWPQTLLDHADIKPYKLLLYPALIFVTFIPMLIHNIAMIFVDKTPEWSLTIHIFLTNIVGFTNACVYIFQRRLYQNVDKVEKQRLSIASERSESFFEDFDAHSRD